MTLKVLLLALTLGVLSVSLSLAVPVPISLLAVSAVSEATSFVDKNVMSHSNVLELPTHVILVHPSPVALGTILFSPQAPPGPTLTISSHLSPLSSSTANSISGTSRVITNTSIETSKGTQTITESSTSVAVSAAPSTLTTVVTVVISESPTPSPSTPTSDGFKTTWSAPAHMTDLGAFNISAFPGGQQNLEIVKGIPATASATGFVAAATESTAIHSWDNSSSVLQLLYPAGSINPGRKPQGGAEFYASPLEMASAWNVTMEYSVFFPADFDWVLAGKLPGLYGGHTGCSGGDSALDCFSTRLMWRKDGGGELYLYAPKDKQTNALCSDPQSVCDATYGLSIGRNSFTWAAGAWTNVRQTVSLNTPGYPDGSFTLDVNGKRVIDRNDVFYRDVPPDGDNEDQIVHKIAKTRPNPGPGGGDGGLLGSLLRGILRRVNAIDQEYIQDESLPIDPVPASFEGPLMDAAADAFITANGRPQSGFAIEIPVDTKVVPTSRPTSTTVISVTSDASPVATTTAPAIATETKIVQVTSMIFPSLMPIAMQSTQHTGQPVGFIGLFFSTFFGGHEEHYATPRDQYTWFKDFGMTFNA